MPRFAEVRHTEWIDAPREIVRRQFADLRHHIDAQVHPKLSFEILALGDRSARFVQVVRLLGHPLGHPLGHELNHQVAPPGAGLPAASGRVSFAPPPTLAKPWRES
jgi:hypothetical protein